MKGPYDDIIHMPHHVSASRSRMSLADRAAQFSPFAALTGYDAAIQEMRRTTDARIELDEDGISMLDEKLRNLAEKQARQSMVAVTYFVPDQRKNGGAYICVTGSVKKVAPNEKALILSDGTVLAFDRIYDIDEI